MAFFRKAGSLLGRTVSAHINQEISSSKPSILQAIRCMSTSKLFIGGLSYTTDDMSLREAFDKYGQVAEARVIVDRETGRSRGFGFVTFSCVEEASAAIQALDQQDLHGRSIRVDYANDRARGYGGGGGFRGGNFGGGGGYGGGGYDGGGYGGNYGGGGGAGAGYGGNYGGGGGGGGGGGYGAPSDAYPDSPNASNNSYGGGNLGYGGDGQNFGVAGGVGGPDNSFSNDASGAAVPGNEGFGNEFGNDTGDAAGEGQYRDEDNYADRRG